MLVLQYNKIIIATNVTREMFLRKLILCDALSSSCRSDLTDAVLFVLVSTIYLLTEFCSVDI